MNFPTLRFLRPGAALLVLAVLAGCGSAPKEIDPTGVDELVIPTPRPGPGGLRRGHRQPLPAAGPRLGVEVHQHLAEGDEAITVTVTDETKVVAGVTATVVHDVAKDEKGTVLEDTYDWYAQDTAGNVWYLGEDTTAYDGQLSTKEGSWEAGVDGAEAGLAMPAEPRVGDGYAQEYYEGVAEDRGEILATDATVTIGYGDYDQVVRTEDTTPLEPDLVEQKYYAPGVGVVMEKTVAGGDEVVELVAFTAG